MLYYNTDPQRQLVRERTDQMAHEMRRARRLTPDEAGYPGWRRLAAELLGRAGSLRRRKGSRDPAYDV
jgi:hypothetical protein